MELKEQQELARYAVAKGRKKSLFCWCCAVASAGGPPRTRPHCGPPRAAPGPAPVSGSDRICCGATVAVSEEQQHQGGCLAAALTHPGEMVFSEFCLLCALVVFEVNPFSLSMGKYTEGSYEEYLVGLFWRFSTVVIVVRVTLVVVVVVVVCVLRRSQLTGVWSCRSAIFPVGGTLKSNRNTNKTSWMRLPTLCWEKK